MLTSWIQYMPGTKMVFGRVKLQSDRNDIITWLRSEVRFSLPSISSKGILIHTPARLHDLCETSSSHIVQSSYLFVPSSDTAVGVVNTSGI